MVSDFVFTLLSFQFIFIFHQNFQLKTCKISPFLWWPTLMQNDLAEYWKILTQPQAIWRCMCERCYGIGEYISVDCYGEISVTSSLFSLIQLIIFKRLLYLRQLSFFYNGLVMNLKFMKINRHTKMRVTGKFFVFEYIPDRFLFCLFVLLLPLELKKNDKYF